MHKANIITLGGMAFYLEEPAYTALESYIDAIKKHYHDSPDCDEIIADIENRFAEYLSDIVTFPNQVLTKVQVEEIMGKIGHIEDFEELEGKAEGKKEAPADDKNTEKRLFRDEEHGMLGGVSAGLGIFFGVDPTFFRLAFVLFTLLGGSGFLIYIIAWVIIPNAKTAEDRMQMHGKPATLNSIVDQMRENTQNAAEKVKNAAQDSRNKSNLKRGLAKTMAILGSIFQVSAKVVGVILILVASIAIASIIAIAISLLFFPNSVFLDSFPVLTSLSPLEYYLIGFAALVGIIIPFILTAMVGNSLLSSKKPRTVSFVTLFTIWIFVLVFSGFSSAPKIDEISRDIQASRITATREISATQITGIDVRDGVTVKLVQGQNQVMKITGYKGSDASTLSRISPEGILIIEQQQGSFSCWIFCLNQTEIEVTLVNPLRSITTADAVKTEVAQELLADELIVTTKDASSLWLVGEVTKLTVSAADLSRLHAKNLTVLGDVAVQVSDASRVDFGQIGGKLQGSVTDLASLRYASVGVLELTQMREGMVEQE